jgi:hypothetical protein
MHLLNFDGGCLIRVYDLDATAAGKTQDRRLRDHLDVLSHDLPVSLRAALPKALTAFASSRHFNYEVFLVRQFCALLLQLWRQISQHVYPRMSLDNHGRELMRAVYPGR